jgi:hypothetical protein
MIDPLIVAFAVVCLLLVAQGMLTRDGIYQFPFLAGCVFAAFILPQFFGLAHDRFLPPGALQSTLILAILSAAMCWIGSWAAHRPLLAFDWDYDDRYLLIASAALTAIGGYFYYKLSRLPPEMLENTQWTGLPVAYLFFARVLTYGFALAVLLYARSGSKLALAIAAYGALFYLDRIVLNGRRQDTVEFLIIILFAFWFQRGWRLPRSVMLAGMIAGGLLINSIGDYRALSTEQSGPQWDRIANIDFVGNLSQIAEQGGAEVRNAAYNIAAVSRSMKFDFGLSHWNATVFAYVPAQLVGAGIKHALFIPIPQPALEEYFYQSPIGSTWTGLSDAFQSFWYFGCLKFFFIAYVMRKFWLAAGNGNLTAQLVYMLIPSYALEAITHGTQRFLDPWVHLAVFLLPLLLLARRRTKISRRGVARLELPGPSAGRG